MRWLLLLILVPLVFFGWTLLSSDGAAASGVLLIFISVGLAMSVVTNR